MGILVPPIVVLAGGLGTRLKRVTGDGPKALAEVAGIPMLRHVLSHWAAHGARHAFLCLGYRADRVEASLSAWSSQPVATTVIREPYRLGTGGAVRNALDRLPEEFFVVNGDTVIDVSLAAAARWNRRCGGVGTLVVSRSATEAGDRIIVNDDGTIGALTGRGGSVGPAWIFAGIALLARSLFEALPPLAEANLERDVLAPAVLRGERLGALRTRRPFFDLGTPERLARYQERLRDA